MRPKAVSFTGHRPERLGGYDKNHITNILVCAFLRQACERLRSEGYEDFISGGALGVDQWAAEIVLDMGLKLTIAIPFAAYGENWPPESRQILEDLKAKANRVVVVCEGSYFDEKGKPQHWKNHKRNQWMGDNGNAVIAVWDGGEKGGTASAVRYSKKIGNRFIRYNPLTKLEEEV